MLAMTASGRASASGKGASLKAADVPPIVMMTKVQASRARACWATVDEGRLCDKAGSLQEEDLLITPLFDTMLSVARAHGLKGKVKHTFVKGGAVQASAFADEQSPAARGAHATRPDNRSYSELCHGGKHRTFNGMRSFQ